MRASRALVPVTSPTSGSLTVDCSCSLMVRPRDVAPKQAPHLYLHAHTTGSIGVLSGVVLPHGHDRSTFRGAFRGQPGGCLDELTSGFETCLSAAVMVWPAAPWCTREGCTHQTNIGPGAFRSKLARIVNHVASSRSRLFHAVYSRFLIARPSQGHAASTDVAHLKHQIDRYPAPSSLPPHFHGTFTTPTNSLQGR